MIFHSPSRFTVSKAFVRSTKVEYSQESAAVGAEERSSALRRRTVDSFDRGEEVLPFVAVRVPLDLLSFANSPGVLHLAQSLLKLSATAVEGSFVVLSGMTYGGFVEAVLLSKQISDGGVVVVEPVLVLAGSATEDGERRRLDLVSKLTPTVFHGGVLGSGGGGVVSTSPDTTDEDQDHTCPHCDRTFTSHIGLVGHLRIHRTETGEPVPGAPTYTHRTRLHCPQCPRTFTHRMGLFGHMRIHESGIDRSLDTPTPPSPTPNPSSCAPTNHSPADIDATDLTTLHSPPSSSSSSIIATTTAASASVAHDFTTAEPDTTTGTTPATSIIRREGQDYICPHCDRTFTSRIGLVGHLRIHRTETGEPVPGAPTYTHRTRLHCPHCPRTFRHRMGLFGHMRIHESGIDHNSDTATTSNISTLPRRTLAPPSHAPTTTTNTTASSTAGTDTADLSCPHCPRTFTSRIGLVGHLRIHRTETDEPVPGAPTYTHRTRLHCPHCPRTFTHRMGLLGHMRIHEDLR
nr:unnamed protein product [Spirometra erinaceieuropaei]